MTDTINMDGPVFTDMDKDKDKEKEKDMMMMQRKKLKKMPEEANAVLPVPADYATFTGKGYNVNQLKLICVHYKIKRTHANKPECIQYITNFLRESHFAKRIQLCWRRYAYKVYVKLRGPARIKRKLCVNETDFFTMDVLSDIPFTQFFSFTDMDGKIYGCDIMSLHTLISKQYLHAPENPYNRQLLPEHLKSTLQTLVVYADIFGEEIQIDLDPPVECKSPTKITHSHIVTLFQQIDNLGNYTSSLWFLNLESTQLRRFLMELYDIWTYRANLSDRIKREICPVQDPFASMPPLNMQFLSNYSFLMLRDLALSKMEILINSGINRDSRMLGVNYVLCALTLVSREAAIALPWLYASVS
jgi:hypothetical protein